MKTRNFLFVLFASVAMFTFVSCEKDNNDEPKQDSNILPSNFKVDIPASISAAASSRKSTHADTIQGNEIYQNLRTFIYVGESAGDMVEEIINAIGYYQINKPITLSYTGNDDKRTKNLVVKETQTYLGKTYEFGLTITDALSESNADGGKALQVFWNANPIVGVAVIKPYNCNRIKDEKSPNAIFRIEYSEVADASYDSHMIVEIGGLNTSEADQFAISSLKMYVGKKGNRVDVYGNSEHPNAKLFTADKGFDWAFVASGYNDSNIGVAEVGLPPVALDNASRNVLLGEYSIKNVLIDQINKWFIQQYGFKPDSESLSGYLKNADAPGYFTNNGFVQAGTSPGSQYDQLASQIKLLTPFNPLNINKLKIEFK